jgi:hypothetical protein
MLLFELRAERPGDINSFYIPHQNIRIDKLKVPRMQCDQAEERQLGSVFKAPFDAVGLLVIA